MKRNWKACFVDLFFLTLVALVGEWMNHKAMTEFYSGYYFSITMVIGFIAIYRWGTIGTVIPVLIGVFSVLFMEGASLQTLLIYTIGNLGMLAAAIYLNYANQKGFKHSPLVYVLSGYSAVVLMKSFVFAILGGDFISGLLLIASNETLNVIATLIFVTLLMKRKNSIMVQIDEK
jgi:hypothetical protein